MTGLEPGELWVLRVWHWIWTGCIVAIAAAADLVTHERTLLPPGVIAAAAFVLMFYYAFVAPGRYFRTFGWKVDESELNIARGVMVRVETTVPFRRVQHIDVAQGAIQRAFGVCSLVLHTAGTQDAKVTLPGLSRETAERLRDEVRAVIARDEA